MMRDERSVNTGNIDKSNMATGDNVQQTLDINMTTTHHGISTSALFTFCFKLSLLYILYLLF
jgi:hypothetical protein